MQQILHKNETQQQQHICRITNQWNMKVSFMQFEGNSLFTGGVGEEVKEAKIHSVFTPLNLRSKNDSTEVLLQRM
jgi:hypothetical protein